MQTMRIHQNLGSQANQKTFCRLRRPCVGSILSIGVSEVFEDIERFDFCASIGRHLELFKQSKLTAAVGDIVSMKLEQS